MDFSVLLSVYYKENPDHLDLALLSLINQTKMPSEIILVKDGPLTPSLEAIIENYNNLYKGLLKIISLKTNLGLGDALNEGLKSCSYDWVARMDSDDICVENRFELQTSFLKNNTEIAVLGGYIEEFINHPGDLMRVKKVPLSYQKIKIFSKKRNPLNHPSVMFRKSVIQNVGGYERMLFFEDYYLWLKLLKASYKIANIDQVLLYFRVGNDMIGRRHGYQYALHELRFAQKAKKEDLFTNYDAIRFVSTRFPLRLISKRLLSTFYKRIIRK